MTAEVFCTACEKGIPDQGFPDNHYQRDNNLVIGFFGGYGQFIESVDFVSDSNVKLLEETYASYEANLCHDCAHKLCEENPWLEKLFKTWGSHSHTQKYWDANPDHYGWYHEDNHEN